MWYSEKEIILSEKKYSFPLTVQHFCHGIAHRANRFPSPVTAIEAPLALHALRYVPVSAAYAAKPKAFRRIRLFSVRGTGVHDKKLLRITFISKGTAAQAVPFMSRLLYGRSNLFRRIILFHCKNDSGFVQNFFISYANFLAILIDAGAVYGKAVQNRCTVAKRFQRIHAAAERSALPAECRRPRWDSPRTQYRNPPYCSHKKLAHHAHHSHIRAGFYHAFCFPGRAPFCVILLLSRLPWPAGTLPTPWAIPRRTPRG